MYVYVTLGRVNESFLSWKSSKYYIFLCVCVRARISELLFTWKSSKYYIFLCVCVRACARDCVHAGIWEPGSLGVSMSVSACSIAYPARNSYTPNCDAICGLSGSTRFFENIL